MLSAPNGDRRRRRESPTVTARARPQRTTTPHEEPRTRATTALCQSAVSRSRRRGQTSPVNSSLTISCSALRSSSQPTSNEASIRNLLSAGRDRRAAERTATESGSGRSLKRGGIAQAVPERQSERPFAAIPRGKNTTTPGGCLSRRSRSFSTKRPESLGNGLDGSWLGN